jgi:putative peptidoglycan lipid II flippase
MKNFFKNGTSLLMGRQTNILSAATIIMVTYGASAVVGLIRDRLLAATFFGGLEWQLDTYFAAFLIPDTMFQLLVIGALSAAFIPIFSQLLAQHQDQDAWYVASASTTVMIIALLCLAVIIGIFAYPISRLVAPGFTPEKLTLMASLVRIMIVAQLFFAISGFLSGILQAHQRFLVPALAPITYNLGIILGIVVLSPFIGIYGPAVGVIIGSLFHFLIQVFPAVRLGFSLRPIWDPFHPAVAQIGRLMVPRTLALGVDRIEQFVAVFLATMLSAGSLSLFNFARHIYLLPASLFGAAIGQASLPVLVGQLGKDLEPFKKTLSSSLLQIFFLSLPAGMGILILRIPLVRIVFGAKSFPWPATIITGQMVALFTLSISAQAIIQLLIRGFYALKDTKTPLVIGLVSAAINLPLSFFLTFYIGMGVRGIALAISLSAIFEALLLLFLLDKVVMGLLNRLFWTALAKMAIATLMVGVILWILMRYLDQLVFDTTRTGNLIALTGVVSFVGFVLYIFLSWVFRLDELKAIVALASRVGKWRQILSESEEVLEQSPTPTSPA